MLPVEAECGQREINQFVVSLNNGTRIQMLVSATICTCLLIAFVSVSAVKIRPKEGDVYFDVVAVVDPVTRDAQKLAPLLSVGRARSLAGIGRSISLRLSVIDIPICSPLFDLVDILFLTCLACSLPPPPL